MSDSSIRLRGLRRRYGELNALDGLDLDIGSGEFVTLLGPSGCGKSTTLNLIAGLDRPDAGTVHLGDRDITAVPPNEREMSMVFQNYALYPHKSVFQNIAFSLKLLRRPPDEIRRRVLEVAAQMDIESLLDRRPGELSGGQQQRVAIGRAMIKEPRVFLLDEPFSNLDAALRSRLRTEIKRLHLRIGATTVFVTHDQEEALSLSDRIAVMSAGALVQYGDHREVYEQPANTYVATFIGKPTMRLLTGVLRYADGRVLFERATMRIDLGPAPRTGPGGSERSITLGMRAEDVSVRPPLTCPERSFSARVVLTEPVGSDTFVELDADGVTVVARAPADIEVVPGDAVTAQLLPGRGHLFDPETGTRTAL